MPQNGIHAVAGMMARRWMPDREWSRLGVVLGNMFPDLDNLAVAYATLTGSDTHGLHRTFTHSVLTVLAVILLFYVIARLTKDGRWSHFGIGLAVGILMHILLDLVLWFDGVEILWPVRYELNFWSWFTAPAWLRIILETGEFLAFGLYFLLLGSAARRQKTDVEHRLTSTAWMYIEFVLFIVFTIIFFSVGANGLPYTVFGGLYLLSMITAILITVRMRRTVEALASPSESASI